MTLVTDKNKFQRGWRKTLGFTGNPADYDCNLQLRDGVMTNVCVQKNCVPKMALEILAPTFDCVSRKFVFNSQGGTAGSVQYMAIGITGWTANPGPYYPELYDDTGTMTLFAKDVATGVVVSRTWRWQDSCTTTYSSTKSATLSQEFTRNNCPAGYIAGKATYSSTKSATATSTASQADADAKALAAAQAAAQADINANGQAWANTNATCTAPAPTTYSSTKSATVSKAFTRNNCPQYYTAGSATYSSTKSATATSTVSQADADAKALAAAQAAAQADVDTNGQAWVNANAACTPPPTVYEDCPKFTGTVNYTGADVQTMIYPYPGPIPTGNCSCGCGGSCGSTASRCASTRIYVQRRRQAAIMGFLILAGIVLLTYQLTKKR